MPLGIVSLLRPLAACLAIFHERISPVRRNKGFIKEPVRLPPSATSRLIKFSLEGKPSGNGAVYPSRSARVALPLPFRLPVPFSSRNNSHCAFILISHCRDENVSCEKVSRACERVGGGAVKSSRSDKRQCALFNYRAPYYRKCFHETRSRERAY